MKYIEKDGNEICQNLTYTSVIMGNFFPVSWSSFFFPYKTIALKKISIIIFFKLGKNTIMKTL